MKKSGFTLSETLITLAILGIIAVIGIPQVVTMAQKHKNEAIRSKAVYQMELGVQKLISDANKTPGNFSVIDKLMLVDNWQSKLLRYIDASETTTAKTTWNFIFGSPAFAVNNLEHVIDIDKNIRPKDPDAPADDNNNSSNFHFSDDTVKFNPESSRDTSKDSSSGLNDRVVNTDLNLDPDSAKDRAILDGNSDTTGSSTDSNTAAINTTSTYKMNHLGANIKFSEINNAKSAKADDIAFEVIIDTNGDKKPNKEGVDQFTYSMKNSGRMIYNNAEN